MAHLQKNNDKPSPTAANGCSSKPLFIIGYMASGKTTFGSALSKRLKRPFIDLDQYIEEKQGQTIAEIFAESGEEGFREIERRLLHEVAEKGDAIISCGGGTPCFFDNMDFINSKGNSVFLEADAERLLTRLIEGSASRPIVKGKKPMEIKDTIERQLALRMPYYNKAKIRWDGNLLETAEEIEKNVEAFIRHNPFVFSESFV